MPDEHGTRRVPAEDATASEALKAAAEGTGERILLGDVFDGVGDRVYGLALLVFALPEALPLPIVGLTAIVAVPLVIVSVWMILFGTGRRLPGWVRRRTVKRSWLGSAASASSRWLKHLERISRPRAAHWTERGRLIGGVSLLLTIVLALPIPFGNIGPALCIAALGVGMLQRDGVIVLGALIASALTLGVMGAVILGLGWAALDATGGLIGG